MALVEETTIYRPLPGRVLAQINNDRVGLTAAGIAFYALLAIFPGLAAVVSLWGLFADPATVSEEISGFSAILPGDVVSAGIQPKTPGVSSDTNKRRATLIMPVDRAAQEGGPFVWHVSWH